MFLVFDVIGSPQRPKAFQRAEVPLLHGRLGDPQDLRRLGRRELLQVSQDDDLAITRAESGQRGLDTLAQLLALDPAARAGFAARQPLDQEGGRLLRQLPVARLLTRWTLRRCVPR